MNIGDINAWAHKQMTEKIQTVLDGEEERVALHYISPSTAVKYLNNIDGVENLEDFDSNGWDWDFWMGFEFEGAKYTLAGSGYQGTLNFYINT